MVPVACIQPLVENALIHGILPTEEAGTIAVCISRLDEVLRVRVLDDGGGMDPSVLAAFQEGRELPARKNGRRHIGIANMRDRITFLYGENYGMEIHTGRNGTCIELILPVREQDMKEMADAKCWSPDILNSTDERQTGLLNGTTASMVWNTGSCLVYGRQANAEHPEWKVTMVDPNTEVGKILNPYINGGMAININSNNKERAMMVINELYTNPKLQDLTVLGIEGKHWEAVGDDQYRILDASGYPTDNNCNWGWSNQEIKRTEYIENRTELDDIHDKLVESFDANIKPEHPLDGFSFDTANVTTQCAAVKAVCGTYYGPLMNGLDADVDASIAEFKAAMESAGIRDIEAELQTQVETYLAEK